MVIINTLVGKRNKKQKTIDLDEYEHEILNAFENRELKPVKSKTERQNPRFYKFI